MLRCPSASTPGIPNPHGLTLWNCHEEIQNQGTSSKRKHETLTTLSMFTPIYWKVKTECAGGFRHQVAAAYDTQVTRHKCMGQHLNTSFANQKRILKAKSNISKQSIVLLRKNETFCFEKLFHSRLEHNLRVLDWRKLLPRIFRYARVERSSSGGQNGDSKEHCEEQV